MKDYRYILGDSSFEVKRLAFQARVWEDMTEGLFDRLKVGPGWKCERGNFTRLVSESL